MPKKFTDLEVAIKNCSTPVMMVLSKGEVASRTTVLRAFSDGKGLNLVSNVDSLYNPVTGERLPYIEKSEQECSGDSFNELDKLIAVRTDDDVVIGVDPDLAFNIAAEEGFCPLTGKETVFHFLAENAEDDSSDDEEFEAVDDTMTDDEDDYSEEEEEEVFEDLGEEEEVEDVTAVEEDTSKEDTSKADTASEEEITEAPTTETVEPVANTEQEQPKQPELEAASEEETSPVSDGTQQEVPAMETTDPDANLKLVTLTTDNSEIAAFVGGVHVGTLKRTNASEKAAPLYEDGSKLVAAFKPVFNRNRDNQKSKELSSYGYTPVTFKVNVGDLFTKRLEKETAAIKKQADERVQSSINDMARLIELSFVGINKGLFDGKNDLANEVASLLRRNGIKNPEREVRRVLAKHSHEYIKSGVEKAKELSSKSEDYIRGIAETVSKSEFSGSVDEEDQIEAARYVPPVNTAEKAEFIGKPDNTPKVNKYSRLFR